MVHSPSTARSRLETLKRSSFFDAHELWKPASSKLSSSAQIEQVRAQTSDGVVDLDPVSVNRPGLTRSLGGATARLVQPVRRPWRAGRRECSRQDRLKHQLG